MKKSLRTIDPAKLSPAVRELNPHLFAAPDANMQIPLHKPKKGRAKKRRQMNATESEFERILQASLDREEIVSFDYEGLTLRWDDGMRYTPDFCVIEAVEAPRDDSEEGCPHGAAVRIKLIEVKGAHCWKADLVKFRAARSAWPLFAFEFWEKTPNGWIHS